MNSQPAKVNPTSSDKFSRNLSRIGTLKQAIEECVDEGRKVSLQSELDRRMAEVTPHRDALQAAINIIDAAQ